MSNGLEFEERVTAFIDILGFDKSGMLSEHGRDSDCSAWLDTVLWAERLREWCTEKTQ